MHDRLGADDTVRWPDIDCLISVNPAIAAQAGVKTMTKIYGLLAICFLIAIPASAETRIPQEELPDALISFAYSVRHGPFILREKIGNRKNAGDVENNDDLIEKYYDIIIKNLAEQEDDFFTGLAFADDYCKVQSGDPGHFCGHTEEIVPQPRAGFVFVTTPIIETGGTVFLIVSSVSPEQTLILSFEEGAPARMIFRSPRKSPGKNKFCTTEIKSNSFYGYIRSIYYMEVVEPGVFMLRESGNGPEHEGENKITLNLRNRKCSMVVEEVRQPTMRRP